MYLVMRKPLIHDPVRNAALFAFIIVMLHIIVAYEFPAGPV